MRIFLNISLLFIFLISFSAHAFPIPKNNKATYDIWRKNKIIGTHEILFSENDDILIVETNIDIEVRILFITVYEFSHQSKEIWKDGSFVRIDAHSDFEDEREYFIEGEIKDDFLFDTLLDKENQALFRKTLAFIDLTDYQYHHYIQLLDALFDKAILRKRELQKLIRLIKLLLDLMKMKHTRHTNKMILNQM